MTFREVPPGYLFSSRFSGKKCSYLKLLEPCVLKESKSWREEGRRVNMILLGPAEPGYLKDSVQVEDITEPTQEGAAVMLRTNFFVFSGERLCGLVNAVTAAPQDSGVLIYYPNG